MTTLRAFTCDDLFRFNNISLDPLTETYGIPFYLQYLAHWPEYFIAAEAPGGELMGYRYYAGFMAIASSLMFLAQRGAWAVVTSTRIWRMGISVIWKIKSLPTDSKSAGLAFCIAL